MDVIRLKGPWRRKKRCLLGNRYEDLELIVKYYQNALQVCTRDGFPIEWAVMQAMLGAVYMEMGYSSSERQESLEQALEHYQSALQILTEEDFPAYWATIQQGLSATYIVRIKGKKTDNIQKAIICGQSSLRVLTRVTYPFEWAGVHTYLGEAYYQATLYADLRELYSGRSVMQEQALRHAEAALQVYTMYTSPQEWAKVQRLRDMIYFDRTGRKRNENLVSTRSSYALVRYGLSRKFFS